MLKRDVQINGRYIAKVSNELTTVRITGKSTRGGWSAINEKTSRQIHIKSASKLRGPADPPSPRNGNGEKMMSENQRDLIEKLLNEKVVHPDLVARYHAAALEDRVTMSAASQFIEHMINRCQRKDTSQATIRRSASRNRRVPEQQLTFDDAPTPQRTDHRKMVATIGHGVGKDFASDEFTIENVREAVLSILPVEVTEHASSNEIDSYMVTYLDELRHGFEVGIGTIISEVESW